MFNSIVAEITSQKEFDILMREEFAVVDCFAEWCMPCVMMAPVIEGLADKFSNIRFVRLNIDDNQSIVSKLNILTVPTLLVLRQGKEVERLVGNLPQELVDEKITKILSNFLSIAAKKNF